MEDIRCKKCNRLLFKAKSADIEIMCPKCKEIVSVKILSQTDMIFTEFENTDL